MASLAGSYLNIPVAQLPERQIVSGQIISFFGMAYVIPTVTDWPGTMIAVNVGGAVIPGLLSLYLLVRNRLWFRGLIAVAVVAGVCHWLARPVPGLGIALPVFVPPLSAAAVESDPVAIDKHRRSPISAARSAAWSGLTCSTWARLQGLVRRWLRLAAPALLTGFF